MHRQPPLCNSCYLLPHDSCSSHSSQVVNIYKIFGFTLFRCILSGMCPGLNLVIFNIMLKLCLGFLCRYFDLCKVASKTEHFHSCVELGDT